MARYWASVRHKHKIPKVIKVDIELPKEQVLDMTTKESRAFFHEFRKQLLQGEIKRRKRNIIVNDRQDLDGKIYNAISKAKGYKLILADTYTFQDEERDY